MRRGGVQAQNTVAFVHAALNRPCVPQSIRRPASMPKVFLFSFPLFPSYLCFLVSVRVSIDKRVAATSIRKCVSTNFSPRNHHSWSHTIYDDTSKKKIIKLYPFALIFFFFFFFLLSLIISPFLLIVKPRELICKAWTGDIARKQFLAPNVVRFIEHFEQMTSWVSFSFSFLSFSPFFVI